MKLFTWCKRVIRNVRESMAGSTLILAVTVICLINCKAVIGAMIYRWEAAWYYSQATVLMKQAQESQEKEAKSYKQTDSLIKEFRKLSNNLKP